MSETKPFEVPERASEKELAVLIELNREIIRHWKLWANAAGPDAYEIACREMKTIRRLVGADKPEETNDATGRDGDPATEVAGA
jgi:hypothetical protein